MTKKEKIQYATSLLMDAGVDFKIGIVSYENTKANNPALEHSAKQFNDALLDEQKRQIDELQKKASKYANKLADACVEIRELKEKLVNITVNNVNAQALKSAESALVYKEKQIAKKNAVIAKLRAQVKDYDENLSVATDGVMHNMTETDFLRDKLKEAEYALVEKGTIIKEKDEVIDDLAKEIGHLYNMVHGDPILNMKERNKRKRGKKPHAKKSDALPTEGNPEEIEMNEAMKRIRKALKEGKTVIVDEECSADIINMNL